MSYYWNPFDLFKTYILKSFLLIENVHHEFIALLKSNDYNTIQS